MTGKAKAIQVMVALAFTAVAYTVYNVASDKRPKAGTNVVNVQSVAPSVKKDKQVKNMDAAEINANGSSTADVPGYSNPDAVAR